MKPQPIIVVKDPEIAKLFSDQTRRKILRFTAHKEMSAADLVKEMGKNYSSIVYHLKQLEDADLIVKTRTEVVQNKLQPYYRAKAWSFHVSYYLNETLNEDEDYRAWQDNLTQRLYDGLKAYGIKVPESSEETVKELIRTMYLRELVEFEGRLDLRDPEIDLGFYIGRSLAKLVSQIRLLRDDEHRNAAEKLSQILGKQV
jgi:DNA-binding transcriptional ArsR family regulator